MADTKQSPRVVYKITELFTSLTLVLLGVHKLLNVVFNMYRKAWLTINRFLRAMRDRGSYHHRSSTASMFEGISEQTGSTFVFIGRAGCHSCHP